MSVRGDRVPTGAVSRGGTASRDGKTSKPSFFAGSAPLRAVTEGVFALAVPPEARGRPAGDGALGAEPAVVHVDVLSVRGREQRADGHALARARRADAALGGRGRVGRGREGGLGRAVVSAGERGAGAVALARLRGEGGLGGVGGRGGRLAAARARAGGVDEGRLMVGGAGRGGERAVGVGARAGRGLGGGEAGAVVEVEEGAVEGRDRGDALRGDRVSGGDGEREAGRVRFPLRSLR